MFFSEDERFLRDAAADFAKQMIAPRVHAMDKASKLDPDLIRAFFEQGLMGIDIPDVYQGGGGTFMMSILAIEEISKVDASTGVFMDVQNTFVNNAFRTWGDEDVKFRYLPRLANDTVGAYALSEAGSGSDAQREHRRPLAAADRGRGEARRADQGVARQARAYRSRLRGVVLGAAQSGAAGS